MNKILLLISLICFSNIIVNCQQKEKVETNLNKNRTDNKSENDTLIVNKQKILSYYKNNFEMLGENEDYYISETDINFLIPIIFDELKKNGFKSISDLEFSNKLKNIFGIDNFQKCYRILDHNKYLTYSMQNCDYDNSLNNCIENSKLMEYLYDKNIFFFKKNTII